MRITKLNEVEAFAAVLRDLNEDEPSEVRQILHQLFQHEWVASVARTGAVKGTN